MPYGLIDYNTLKDIGDAIREKANSTRNYYPRDFAAAINQIQTSGGGFDEPVALKVTNNTTPLGGPPLNYAVAFEQINVWPENGPNGSWMKMIEDVSWGGMSPDKMSLYFHAGPDGYKYGLYVDGDKWANDQASIIDISNMFTYCYNLREAYCGKYTTNMFNAYYCCYNLRNAACGPYVQDMSNAYYSCSNLTKAVVGERVTNMAYAYASCSNITEAVFGPNVEDLRGAYQWCYNLVGNVIIPSSAKNIDYAFAGCYNLHSISGNVENVINAGSAFAGCNNANIDWNDFNWVSLRNGANLYENVNNITDVGDFLCLTQADGMFENCHNLVNVGNFGQPRSIEARDTFRNCYNLSQESHDRFINAAGSYSILQSTFVNCQQIKNVHFKNGVIYVNWSSTYSGVPIENLTFEDNVNSIGNALSGCGIIDAVSPDSLIYDNHMYHACPNLVNAACGNNITTMYYTYWECPNLVNAACGPNVVTMDHTYYRCNNLVNAVCGENVTNLFMTYVYCNNLIYSACGNNVTMMFDTYENCPNLQYANVGPNVVNIYAAFNNCISLNHDVIISSEKLNYFGYAFMGANNLQNIAIHSAMINANKQVMQNAFYRTNYSLRRNIVLTNLASFNNFIIQSYNSCGYFSKTNETYAEPVAVNVNGVEYDAVRCAYNTIYNCYIYCTE